MPYSQYEEETIIANFFGPSFVGTFLDIGAADGVRNSNTRALAERGWKGWLVEPLPSAFSELLKLYSGNPSIALIHGAVSDHGKPVRFYTGKEGQLSTASRETAKLEHMRPWLNQNFFIPTLTPKDMMEIMGNDEIDFVSLDCEGLDLEIARACQDLFKKVKLLCYESDMPGQSSNPAYEAAWHEVITQLGFTRQVGKTQGNTLVARS
jgi:FkbM family methyltransferase